MQSCALILMYHHIADAPSDAGVLSVSPKHFEEHLQVIRSVAHPISLTGLTAAAAARTVPRSAIAVTLDDGYADNLYAAKPLLSRFDIPATVFVTTGGPYLGPEFWWDEVERRLLLPGSFPEHLHLPLGDQELVFDLGGSAVYTEAEYLKHRRWRVWEEPPTERHRLYQQLCPALKPMRHESQQRLLSELRAFHVPESALHIHRRLIPSEIQETAERGLIDIGAHTVTHPMLSTLDPASQQAEIEGSIHYLNEIVDQRIETLSYPYGDYSGETIRIARAAGLNSACSVIMGSVEAGADLFQLPRHNIFDIGGDEFDKWLRRVCANS